MPSDEPAFVYDTSIATTPQLLWAALTDGTVTRQYWFDRRIESDWQVGTPVRFFDAGTDVVMDSGVVLECESPHRLAYTFRQEAAATGDDAPSAPTRVSFELTPTADGRVRLLLVHDQLVDPGDVEGWRGGWTPILTNLQDLLEGRRPQAEARRP